MFSKLDYTPEDFERRSGHGQRDSDDERPEGEIDRARIIHSSAFRRLQGKTQVFTPGQSDFFRTRLTHSLEVAQIAKGLALRLGADPDVCEAAGLAHDIGHPPFGHKGETVLHHMLADYGGFEANAQNFRVVGEIEEKFADTSGLDLSLATLDALLKYDTPYSPGMSNHFYYEFDETVEWVIGHPSEGKSFECQIMDFADDIAYAVHDFDDGIHAGLISTTKARSLFDEIFTLSKKRDSSVTEADVDWALEQIPQDLSVPTKTVTSTLVSDFVRSAERKETSRLGSAESVRYANELGVDAEMKRRVAALRSLSFVLLVFDDRVHTLESRADEIITRLVKFLSAKGSENAYPGRHRDIFLQQGVDEGGRMRLAADYVSGMTDAYASRLFRRLFTADYQALHEF